MRIPIETMRYLFRGGALSVIRGQLPFLRDASPLIRGGIALVGRATQRLADQGDALVHALHVGTRDDQCVTIYERRCLRSHSIVRSVVENFIEYPAKKSADVNVGRLSCYLWFRVSFAYWPRGSNPSLKISSNTVALLLGREAAPTPAALIAETLKV